MKTPTIMDLKLDTPKLETKCPMCGKPTDPHYKPFCSKRCADVDLGRWLTETYVIETDEEDQNDEV